MTYRELLEQKLINNGASVTQAKSKTVDIMIKTLALESNPDLDQFVKILEEDKERYERETIKFYNARDEYLQKELACKSRERVIQEEYKRLEEKEAELKSLRDQIDECETAEAKDRIRLADRFTGMIERKGGITNGWERTAYIKSLGAILGSISPNNFAIDDSYPSTKRSHPSTKFSKDYDDIDWDKYRDCVN